MFFRHLLGEHHRLVVIDQDTILEVPLDGTRENRTFDVAALAREIADRVAMRGANDVLLDDRAFVEILSRVMGGRSEGSARRWGDYSVESLLALAKVEDKIEVVTGVLTKECNDMIAG